MPPILERIILRPLATRPEERYPNAEELPIELRQYPNRACAQRDGLGSGDGSGCGAALIAATGA